MLLLLASTLLAPGLSPSDLKCESITNPLGMDVPRPRLSWIVKSSETGQRQTAYRILVASDRARLARGKADLWDSGRVASGQTRDVVYGGKPLRSVQKVFWNVRTWDKDGVPSAP